MAPALYGLDRFRRIISIPSPNQANQSLRPPGIKFLCNEDKRAIYEVSSGIYHFISKLPKFMQVKIKS